ACACMLDEFLPHIGTIAGTALAELARQAHLGNEILSDAQSCMTSLLDQSALTDLAERLIAAARKAGADAADAIALRSVSLAVELREGKVEDTERSESDDVGLRVLCGRRQAVVSTNDITHNGIDALVERA